MPAFLVRTARCGRLPGTPAACTAATRTPSSQWSTTAPVWPCQCAGEPARSSLAWPTTAAAARVNSAVRLRSLWLCLAENVSGGDDDVACDSAVCNQSLCDLLPPECKYGEKLVSYYRQDSCCPDYVCGEVPLSNASVIDWGSAGPDGVLLRH